MASSKRSWCPPGYREINDAAQVQAACPGAWVHSRGRIKAVEFDLLHQAHWYEVWATVTDLRRIPEWRSANNDQRFGMVRRVAVQASVFLTCGLARNSASVAVCTGIRQERIFHEVCGDDERRVLYRSAKHLVVIFDEGGISRECQPRSQSGRQITVDTQCVVCADGLVSSWVFAGTLGVTEEPNNLENPTRWWWERGE